MFPASFEYVRAHTTDEAFAALQQHGYEGRVLAGGQSLIPAMRYRLARPGVLVDINPIKELSYLREENGVLRIGATTRDAALEFAPWIKKYSLINDVSRVVADPVVRHMGTVVGSICHNDPAGDWTATALAARATVVVRGVNGLREISIDDFLVDSYTTAVEEGEMALELNIPIPDAHTQGSYQKIERKVGDYATCAAAIQIAMNADGTIRQAGIAITAVGAKPCASTPPKRCWLDKNPASSCCVPPPRKPRRSPRQTPISVAVRNTKKTWLGCWCCAACSNRSSVWGCGRERLHEDQWEIRQRRRGQPHTARVLHP
jgi:aerobic carbon-monoxide dehydrogenase medium subunit